MKRWFAAWAAIVAASLLVTVAAIAEETVQRDPDASSPRDVRNLYNALDEIRQGRGIFRNDTFGDEAFWGDALRLHEAIAGSTAGGVGPGLSPKAALAVGLKVDAEALPHNLRNDLRRGKVNLDDPATTLTLLKLDAVVGVRGFFDGRRLKSVGITCALCHSTVDDSLAPGIGRRLDGWAARDLNVGAIIALFPTCNHLWTCCVSSIQRSMLRQFVPFCVVGVRASSTPSC